MTPLFNMFPGLSGSYLENGRSPNLKCLGDLSMRAIGASYLTHILGCKFRIPPFFSNGHTSLRDHISHIVSLSSNKKVFWINARTVITRMTNLLSSFYWAVLEFKGKPMSHDRPSVSGIKEAVRKLSAPRFLTITCPIPTFRWRPYVYKTPKSFLWGLGWGWHVTGVPNRLLFVKGVSCSTPN